MLNKLDDLIGADQKVNPTYRIDILGTAAFACLFFTVTGKNSP